MARSTATVVGTHRGPPECASCCTALRRLTFRRCESGHGRAAGTCAFGGCHDGRGGRFWRAAESAGTERTRTARQRCAGGAAGTKEEEGTNAVEVGGEDEERICYLKGEYVFGKGGRMHEKAAAHFVASLALASVLRGAKGGAPGVGTSIAVPRDIFWAIGVARGIQHAGKKLRVEFAKPREEPRLLLSGIGNAKANSGREGLLGTLCSEGAQEAETQALRQAAKLLCQQQNRLAEAARLISNATPEAKEAEWGPPDAAESSKNSTVTDIHWCRSATIAQAIVVTESKD
ncbi:hypothetical protein ERJ75_001545400 [Trypanosoma vivax]|uniref:Uncharacterized protein n=1 Tax=Trypanosoma vivax (strain Y486) TaxID=1055687 RepID=F9WPB1_TRYVY|nr:hypothetical protein ERJ75_001546000 [Trypanosoma vivax]KAH8606144.1 hypothetical protein ERJ75_001545400 [Trypanosoma vivax]CCD19386.1 hypothetical protein, conserved in T. vivax [Trypanosoma vivax Y486]|eukprot:CCD19386.1 hypothetical protein, conserved in T. vivax [Trypanosoma vivax Y486]